MKLPEPGDDFQSAYFITDWWDGPKSGFADFNNNIHCFERIFDTEKDDWSDSYWIRPVSTEEYSLQIEAYKLFLDWINDKGSTRPHPSLDTENKRYHEVEQLLVEFEHQFYIEKYIGEFMLIAKDGKENGNKIYELNYKVKWTRKD